MFIRITPPNWLKYLSYTLYIIKWDSKLYLWMLAKLKPKVFLFILVIFENN